MYPYLIHVKLYEIIVFILTSVLLFQSVVFSQTDFQLRDPEYLIEQYNQLVAKHNALIEKTRIILTEKKQTPQIDIVQEERLKQQLNESEAKISTLENELNKIKTKVCEQAQAISTLTIQMQDLENSF